MIEFWVRCNYEGEEFFYKKVSMVAIPREGDWFHPSCELQGSAYIIQKNDTWHVENDDHSAIMTVIQVTIDANEVKRFRSDGERYGWTTKSPSRYFG